MGLHRNCILALENGGAASGAPRAGREESAALGRRGASGPGAKDGAETGAVGAVVEEEKCGTSLGWVEVRSVTGVQVERMRAEGTREARGGGVAPTAYAREGGRLDVKSVGERSVGFGVPLSPTRLCFGWA